MNTYPYLIALALIEQDGKRLLPLGGKSLKKSIEIDNDPSDIGKELANQVLLRVFQKSESKPLRRAYGERSLLVIQIPMSVMQEKIPLIKANWINYGDNERLIQDLNQICMGVWSINFSREGGVNFSKLS